MGGWRRGGLVGEVGKVEVEDEEEEEDVGMLAGMADIDVSVPITRAGPMSRWM
jgi:hypothetical protein